MTIDLQKFCSVKDDSRYFLHAPFSRGKYTYATNGHIVVRVARRDDVPEVDLAPKPESLFKEKPRGKFIPVPKCSAVSDLDCKKCEGTGARECNMGHDHECDKCEGTGKTTNHESMKVGPSHYQKRLLALIQGWEISPEPGMKAAWIRTDGADGLLIPTRV